MVVGPVLESVDFQKRARVSYSYAVDYQINLEGLLVIPNIFDSLNFTIPEIDIFSYVV